MLGVHSLTSSLELDVRSLCLMGVILLGLWAPGRANAGPSRTERAKVEQKVGPFRHQGDTLRQVLQDILSQAKQPIEIDACPELLDARVSLTTSWSEGIDVILKSLSFQVGSPLRLYRGEHAEKAHPTFFCADRKGVPIPVPVDGPARPR